MRISSVSRLQVPGRRLRLDAVSAAVRGPLGGNGGGSELALAVGQTAAALRGQCVVLLDTDTLPDDNHDAQATASGTASDLLLALYGRIGFDVLDVSGDRSLLEALRTG